MSNPIARINGEFPATGRFALSAIAAVAVTTQAVEFENDVIEGNLDTTLSYGASFRTSDADPGNIGITQSTVTMPTSTTTRGYFPTWPRARTTWKWTSRNCRT